MDGKKILWELSIEAWLDSSQVIGFIEDAVAGLHDKDGDPLPDEAKQFFIDLLHGRVKARKGKWLQRPLTKILYQTLLPAEQLDLISGGRPHGVSPSDWLKTELAKISHVSVACIDQIVSPRKSRPARKPRKS